MKLSQTNAYAIAAVAYLANVPAGKIVSNTEICQATQMPGRYVLQLLRELVKADVLISTRGIFGGYRLARPANKITLLEIIEAVEGPIGASGVVELAISSKGRTALANAFAAIEADARKRLGAITLSDLRAAKPT